jgi:hypothetical protein
MNYATSSGEKTASAAIVTGPGALQTVIVTADGTNAATVVIYDSLSAAGTILARVVVDAGLVFESLHLTIPVVANTGIYLSISGTGAAAVVHYTTG